MLHSRISNTRALAFALSVGFLFLAGCDGADPTSPLEASVALSAGMAKTDVCHRTMAGSFTKISVADAAYETHIAHGDGGVGEAVPGTSGYEFDGECQPQTVVIATCPCFSVDRVEESIGGWWSIVLSDSYEQGFFETTLSAYDPAFGEIPLFQTSAREIESPTCTDILLQWSESVTSEQATICRSILLEFES
jgi:hypothetical protein